MFEKRAPWADRVFKWIAPPVLILSALGGAYYYYRSHHAAPAVQSQTKAPPAAQSKPGIQHPIPSGSTSSATRALPALNESDASLQEAFEGLFGKESVQQMLVPDGIVRRIVVTIDNLPRQKVAVERRPLKALSGQTKVVTQGDTVTLSEANAARYAPYMQLLKSMDMRTLADLYLRFYPLFQQAYEDLGYPDQYFNDRLVAVIDHLLAAPEIPGNILLAQPKVFYEFADPQLEARSAGQKLLIRLGRDNEALAKAKLRELRALVAARPAAPKATK